MNHSDFLERATKAPNLARCRLWYETLQARLQSQFGNDGWFPVAAAWAATQDAGLSPKQGSDLVLGIMSKARRQGTAGGPHAQLIEELSGLLHEGRLPSQPSAYDCDLTDVLLNKTTRTCMGNDPRGGVPVPIDIWTFRSAGYVDRVLKDHLIATFGHRQAAPLHIDEFGEDQYEACNKFYTRLAKDLDERGWLAMKGWLPHQAAAIGRLSMHQEMGITFSWPEDLF